MLQEVPGHQAGKDGMSCHPSRQPCAVASRFRRRIASFKSAKVCCSFASLRRISGLGLFAMQLCKERGLVGDDAAMLREVCAELAAAPKKVVSTAPFLRDALPRRYRRMRVSLSIPAGLSLG